MKRKNKDISHEANMEVFKHNRNLEILGNSFFIREFNPIPYIFSCDFNTKGQALVIYFATKTDSEIDEEYGGHMTILHKETIVLKNYKFSVYDASENNKIFLANSIKLAFIKSFLSDIKINNILECCKDGVLYLSNILDAIILAAFNCEGFVDQYYDQPKITTMINFGKRYLRYLDAFANYWLESNGNAYLKDIMSKVPVLNSKPKKEEVKE